MDKALKIIQSWCQAKGLTVNPSKTEAMIFTRKYKPEPIGPLRLWGKELPYTSSVKYLGIHLDPKLSWKFHLEVKRKKFYTSMWACRRAVGKTWGIKPSIALWIYKVILLPRLTYAAMVWWPRVEKVVARNLLRSLQDCYLRATMGAMKTTPTEALEIALCLPPLNRFIISTAKITAYPHGTETSNGCPLDVYHGDSKPPLDVHETSRKHLLDIHSSAFHRHSTSIRRIHRCHMYVIWSNYRY